MSNHSRSSLTWITCNYLDKILQHISKNDVISVQNFTIEPGSSVGDNYAGQIFRIKCQFTDGNRKGSKSIIAKALPDTELANEIIPRFDYHTTEIKMLSETLPLLSELLREKIETQTFFPQFYKLDIQNKLFFMEDLKADGYVLPNRILSLDLDHVVLVVKSLAKMHASSYILLKQNPEYKNTYLNYLLDKGGSPIQKLIEGRNHIFLKSLHLWPISEEDKQVFRKLKFYDMMMGSYERKESSFNVIIHGDCWTSNLMFQYENRKPVSVKIFDYQFSNYNSIGLDLNFFIFSSSQTYVKLDHLDAVLKIYHDTFVRIAGDTPELTLDIVHKEFREKLGFGFCIACLFRPGDISEIPSDMAAYFEGRESENNMKIFQNEKYISEVVNLLPLFKKYGVFK